MHVWLLSCLVAVGAAAAVPPAAAVGGSSGASIPSSAPPAPHRVLVVMQAAAPEVDAVIAAQLKADGAQQVPEAAVRAGLAKQVSAQASAQQAEELRRRGVDAEQNLDLEAAIAVFTQAEGLLEQAGAAALDPGSLAQVRLELAQGEDEKGDLPAAQAELRRWAELAPDPLDPKTYPPAFVALSREAQATTPSKVPPLSLASITSTALVDEVVVVALAGLSDAPRLVLFRYRAGRPQPDRIVVIPVASKPAEQRALAEGPVRELFGAGGASRVDAEAALPVTPVVAPGSDLKAPLTLMAGFIFPQDDAYSRYGASTLGIGLALGGRVGLPFGEVGLRLDIIGGSFAIAQITPTIRWTWHKSRVTFDIEPGAFLQFRGGSTGAQVSLGADVGSDPSSSTSSSNVLFGLEAGTGIGYQLSESWSLEEQFTLGVVLAGNFDTNVPFGFQTRLAYTF